MQNSNTPKWDMLCSVNTELQRAREKMVKHQNKILFMVDMNLNTQQILEDHTDLELVKEALKPLVKLAKELESEY